MTAMTDTLENILIDYYFRGVAPTLPTNLYIGLMTAAPSDTGPGTEVTGAGYARVSVSRATASWNGTHGSTSGNSSGTNGTTTNAIAVNFAVPTANWGNITHWGVWDAATGGNLHWYGALTTSKTVNSGDAAPQFLAGQISIQIDN
ncbi:conserved protein of unknown function (plasmid) [Rhodovastum atsumiense]|uniref:Uncharacterized protein n=1 Tax=Rhodovastum atsumiense TaxID=504468 RepID=A0A5M6IUP6_9PROT|nr:hypothetical protein [Rhodovastum atsumiense]KAA5611587.1 hypothetical protein F1189_13565 [Rhodovastum atsumiense]CAH2606330.1 conserved protein of unknown function [Rhodovastum atsumiense]